MDKFYFGDLCERYISKCLGGELYQDVLGPFMAIKFDGCISGEDNAFWEVKSFCEEYLLIRCHGCMDGIL